MNINEKRKAFEKLLTGAPEVMSPLQVSNKKDFVKENNRNPKITVVLGN